MVGVAAILAIFVYGLNSAVLGALLPSYALNADQQGMLALVNALGLAMASLCAGPLVDIKGKKLAIVLGLVLADGSLARAPLAHSYANLLSVYFLLGAGGGIVITAANSLVGEVEASKRAAALNFSNLFFGLGGIVTSYCASYVLTPAALCYSIAAAAIAALAVNLAAPVSKRLEHRSYRLVDAPRLLAQTALLFLSLTLFLYVACEVSVWNWLKAYLISIDFSAQTAGGIVSYGFALGILVGRLVVSRVLIRAPAINVVLVSGVVIAVTTFAMLHLSSRWSVTLAVFCAGLAMAPVFPTVLAMVADRFPHGTATAMAIAITSGWIGLAVSSPVVGWLAEGSSLQHALLLLPLLATVMVLVNLVLRVSLRRSQRA